MTSALSSHSIPPPNAYIRLASSVDALGERHKSRRWFPVSGRAKSNLNLSNHATNPEPRPLPPRADTTTRNDAAGGGARGRDRSASRRVGFGGILVHGAGGGAVGEPGGFLGLGG